MKNQTFNPHDSIKTIEDSFRTIKSEKTGASFYYILWGTVLFIHNLLHFIALRNPELNGALLQTTTWLLFPIGGWLSFRRKSSDERTEHATSLFEKVYFYAFIGFAMTYGTMTMASMYLHLNLLTACYPMLLGVTVFIVGGVTGHRPSIIGGVLGILLTNLSIYASSDFQYLLAAIASLVVCVLPGYLMRNSHV